MWKFAEDKTEPILTAKKHIESLHAPEGVPALPETAVLFFMHSGPEYLVKSRACGLLTPKLPRFLGGCPVWRLRDRDVCFLDGGRGAPQAADTVETLAALGVKTVVSVGMIGSFSEKIPVGGIVVPPRAFVEEGTSLHYFESIAFSEPDPGLSAALASALGAERLPVVSSDSIYRQTFYKERLWRVNGAVGVDMETSAVFSVGRYLGLRTAAALMVSDRHPLSPDAPGWEWRMTGEMRAGFFEKTIRAVTASAE